MRRRHNALLATVAIACNVPNKTSGDIPDDARLPTEDATLAIKDAAILAPDAAPPDAAPIDASPDAPPPPPPPGRVLYPEGTIQSPITADMAQALRARAQQTSRQDRVFAKVGDSITATAYFLACFDGSVDLSAHGALSSTLGYFRGGNAGGTSPFSRASLSARGGWLTADALAGDPSPLEREVAAVSPRYGIVMLGTNDLRSGRSYDAADGDLWTIADDLLAMGVIPILSTIPANLEDGSVNARVGLYNRFARAIAQGRGIPLVDYHRAMAPLANEGISSDGIHPSVSSQGACDLDDAGLGYGHNLRNLLSLEALDRARRAIAGEALDDEVPRRTGTGTNVDPIRASLPIADLGDTRKGDAFLAGYCGLAASGHEFVYRIDLTTTRTIQASLVDRGPVEVDVAILQGSLAPTACIAAGDRAATATVGPGTVYIVVDSSALTSEGEFLLVVQ